MEENKLPFLNRKLVSFDRGTKFDLEIKTKTDTDETIIVTGMTKDGFFRYDIEVIPSDDPVTTLTGLTDIPLWVSVKCASETNGVNNTYCQVYLLIDETKSNLMCEGYLGHLHGISWPSQLPQTTLQEHGKIINTIYDTFGAGNENFITIPRQEFWKVKSIRLYFLTGINIQDRTVSIAINFPNGGILQCLAGTATLANTLYIFNLVEGGVVIDGANKKWRQSALVDDLIIPGSSTIQTKTDKILADDEYTQVDVVYEKFYSKV